MLQKSQAEIIDLRIDMLVTDPYQRNVSSVRVNKLVENYDPNKLDPVTVSLRNNAYYILDGQHRVSALRKLGAEIVTCRVLKGLTREQEAEIFMKQGDNRRGLSWIDRHKAAVISGDETAMAIQKVADDLSITIGKFNGTSKGCVSAVQTLYLLTTIGGADYLKTILTCLTQAWDYNSDGFQKGIMMGLHLLIKDYPQFDKTVFVRQMKKTDPMTVINKAKTVLLGDSTHEGYKQALQLYYNKNLKTENRLGRI